MQNRSSFVLYTEYDQHLELLTDEECGRLFRAIMQYAATGESPDLVGAERMAFSFIRAQIDKDATINHRATYEYKSWRTDVLTRDDHTCQICGATNDLHAHHILSYCDYPALRMDLPNGITLCKNCHVNVHRGVIMC